MHLRKSVSLFQREVSPALYSIFVGVVIGLTAGMIGLGIALIGPVGILGAVLGVLAGLYLLSNVSVALYGVIFTAALLPFGTLPFKIAVTPTLLDLALGAFVLVYLMQWMTGRRQGFRLAPVHILVALYAFWLLLAFALGLRYAPPTSAILRQFAETLLAISLVFILVDLLRDPEALRRLVIVVMIAIGAQALIAIILYVIPDTTTEQLLIRLARIGYPDGGVIRYIEDNPANAERAIGTWVDPNALGGILAISATIFAPQVFARRPIMRYRWLSLATLGLVATALLLTFSRASMLAFAVSLCFIGLFPGYRKYLVLVAVGGILLLALPQTRSYIERFSQAFSGTDLATQMRLGEYGDSLELISRYPITGIGFTGTPDIDVYSNAASLYLIMANQIGLVGLGLFLLMIVGILTYGWRVHRLPSDDVEFEAIHLGYHAALVAALINATADLYFFRLDFQSSITSFWLLIALAITSSRLIQEQHKSTVAKMD
ncbi:MAG: O-antigen ligase family protein [Anaerolineae bacterium]